MLLNVSEMAKKPNRIHNYFLQMLEQPTIDSYNLENSWEKLFLRVVCGSKTIAAAS